MAIWGTGISSNDTYADTYRQFFDLYNEGLSVTEITKKLIDENQETINLEEDAPNFWFAVANAQWECKAPDNEIFSKVEHIINSGEDIKIWKELDATPAELRAREKVLKKFLSKLQTEKDKPRKRTKKRLYNSVYQKGDCLTYVMNNGNYGGAFVLTDEYQTKLGINYIAITTIDQPTKPNLDDFRTAEVYIKRVNKSYFCKSGLKDNLIDEPQIGSFFASVKNTYVDIEIIGQLPVYKEYKIKPLSEISFNWNVLKSKIPYKDEYAKRNGQVKTKLKLSKWTKK